MGYIAHDAIIVTTSNCRPGGLPDIDTFRESLPAEFQPLVIGPVPAVMNGYLSYVFLPDGSKEGWDISDAGDEYRSRFVALFDQRFEDGSTHDQWIGVRFGGASEYNDAARITGSYASGVAA